MRLRFRDRLLSALAGVLLLAGSAALVADCFFGRHVFRRVAEFLAIDSFRHRAAVVVAVLLLVALGGYLLLTLIRHERKRKSFVMQKTDDGELSISMKTLESLVRKCFNKDDELRVNGTELRNHRDGLLIDLKATAPAGVNIPLITSNLQKQIRAYVTACSGVDVKEVRVRIEAMDEKEVDSPYGIASPQVLVPGAAPAQAALPQAEEEGRGNRKPALHQRLFGHKELLVDMPPAPEQQPEAKPAAPELPEEAAESPEDPEAMEAMEAMEAEEEAEDPEELDDPEDFEAAEDLEAAEAAEELDELEGADSEEDVSEEEEEEAEAPEERQITPDAVDFAEMAAEQGVWNTLPGEEEDLKKSREAAKEAGLDV